MRLSKILKLEDAGQVAFNFNPKKFPIEVPEVASGFIQDGQSLGNTTGFKLNELISKQIGLSENEKKRLEEKVDALAVEKLKEVQEQAYKEAYELGLEEGRRQAFDASTAEFNEKLESLNQLAKKITYLKKDLVAFNEAHIVKTMTILAGKVAMREIMLDPEAIIPVISSVMDATQGEERVKIRISSADFEFINSLEGELGKKIENFETIKFEVDDHISPGGCIVEGNYGVIDATIEQRVKKVWDILEDKTPHVKQEVG